jgi:hypothetical protein
LSKTFGTLSYEDGKWVIKAEAHVALMLKRVFGKINKNSHGRITMLDTVDTARNLEWFVQRYPLEYETGSVERRLKGQSDKHRERASLVERILSRVGTPRDFVLAEPLRDYQKLAVELALAGGGLLVCDEMGLGKTPLAIGMMTEAVTRPALVVAPKAIQRQWQRQIKRFAPGLTVHILQQGTPYDLGKSKAKGKKVIDGQQALPSVQTFPDVIISTPSKLPGWSETIAGIVKLIVLDECQEFRNGGNTAKGAAAKHIGSHATYRLGLSGTPIHNHGAEMFEVCELIRPGALGEREEFLREWCKGLSEKVDDPKAFGAFLRAEGIMLRRTRSEVGRELPGLSRVFHDIDSDAEPIDDVEEAATALARTVLSQGREAFAGERLKASGELSYLLRQATGVAKAVPVADFVRMLVEQDQPVVLSGWHRRVYEIWNERLAAYKPVMVTGSESDKQKDDALQEFIKGRSRVIIISLRSAAGLDGLQFASRTVVHGELDWSPAIHEQFDTRVFRDGQKDPVFSYYLLSQDGSDPIVQTALRGKGEQLQGIRDPDVEFFHKLQNEDPERVRNLAEAFLNRRSRPKEVA